MFLVLGFCRQFEELMNTITQTKRTTAVVNGTAGLQVALDSLGVEKD